VKRLNELLREKDNLILRRGFGVNGSDAGKESPGQLADRLRDQGRELNAMRVRCDDLTERAVAMASEAESFRADLHDAEVIMPLKASGHRGGLPT